MPYKYCRMRSMKRRGREFTLWWNHGRKGSQRKQLQRVHRRGKRKWWKFRSTLIERMIDIRIRRWFDIMIIARCQMTDRSLFITIITAAGSDNILAAFIMLFYHQMDNLSFSAGLHTGPLAHGSELLVLSNNLYFTFIKKICLSWH